LLSEGLEMAHDLDFVQIVYLEEQKSACFPFARIHFNDKLTTFFENSVIKDVVLHSEAEKIAVCSWKLKEKMRWNVCRPRELTEQVLKTNFEVMSFTCNTKHHQFLQAADKWHPGFVDLMKKILNEIEKDTPSEIKNPIYQNHFCATKQVYKKYVREYLAPAMDVMERPGEIRELCWKDSNYSNLNKSQAATAERLQASIGVPYYPMHAFILERLFSIFCHNEKVKVTYL
jgi:hypothetical protein